MNSPILTIPGVSHFSGTSILAELGDICNYSSAAKIIKFAGLAPYEHQSSQYRAEHLPISKKGSKYLRKTLYQVILPVIRYNTVFQDYYRLKRSQGKGHRCAQGHCIRKLLRIVYHLLSTNQAFDPLLLKQFSIHSKLRAFRGVFVVPFFIHISHFQGTNYFR